MVCQWWDTISGAIRRLPPDETQIPTPFVLRKLVGYNDRLRPQDVGKRPFIAAFLFSAVRFNQTHNHVQHSLPQSLYEYLLSIILEVGFRLAGIGFRFGSIDPNHTPHHKRIIETAFSSDDDEVVADAVHMWITINSHTPLGSFARHFTKRLERGRPLSRRLRQLIIDVIERIWDNEPWESGPETVRLLNCLDADMDGLREDGRMWLLSNVMCGPGGLELSPHYWRLLDGLVLDGTSQVLVSGNWDIMRALREVEDWERLEVWMSVMWKPMKPYSTPELMEEIRQVTLELLSQRPSALQRFENICGEEESNKTPKRALQDICKRARAENPPSEDSPGLPYVSLQPAGTYLSDFALSFSQLAPTHHLIPLVFAGDDSF